MVVTHRPDPRRVHLHIGHASGGTTPHLSCEIVSGQTSVRRLFNQGSGSNTQATGMVLVEPSVQQQAADVCGAMVDGLLPRLWALINDPEAALAALRAWAPPSAGELQASVIAIRWPHCLLYADGWHRLAIVRKHRVRIIASNRSRLPIISAEDLRIDDRVVMMSESTSEALPIPAIVSPHPVGHYRDSWRGPPAPPGPFVLKL